MPDTTKCDSSAGLRSLEMRLFLRAALLRVAKIQGREGKKHLLSVLKKATDLGWLWVSRPMYGGGYEVTVWDGADKLDDVATITVSEEGFYVTLTDEYFTDGYKETVARRYNPEFDSELEAELRNEEILYGYEVPRPWVHYR